MGDVISARASLLTLHRALLEWQRRQVERFGGRMSAGEVLQAAADDLRFDWLKELTAVIAELDAGTPSEDAGQARAALGRARALLDPPAPDSAFGRRYLQALQDDPGVVLYHRDAVSALRAAPGPE
jgi:hypothetical protein